MERIMLVFGAGAALAGLAGVIAGPALVAKLKAMSWIRRAE